MYDILMGLGLGFVMGSSISYFIYCFFDLQKIKEKKQEAQHIIQKAKDTTEQYREHTLHKIEDYKLFLVKQQNNYIAEMAQTTRQLQIEIEQKKNDNLNQLRTEKKAILQSINACSTNNAQKELTLNTIKNKFYTIQTTCINTLKDKFNINIQDITSQSQKKWIDNTKNKMLQQIKHTEEQFNHNVNQQAHFILDVVLNRFQYPHCPERGIKMVTFNSKKAMKHILGADFSVIKILEKQCGVDMKIHDQEPNISILGIDPVRKELGRASLQKIVNKNYIKKHEIPKIVQETKKQLFRQIKTDGQKICRILNLTNVQPEIQNMMGALRYRYSFAQNQHFHCQEVAWLCGLLSLELKEPVLLARRTGMLHDIGKAMDHSKEGGHAVIGADFIKKYGEQEEVVYAVKAHHHDITPKHSLDFLVIAADAISGARPGARRSTVESYNQKVLTLEKIGNSFAGVKDTYIMSAGRKIRVIVDSDKVNDLQALELSKQIASKIEDECSYPGLIQVTVLRTVTQTIDVQTAAKQAH